MPETADALPPALDPRGRRSARATRAPRPTGAPRHHAAPGGLSSATAIVLLVVLVIGTAAVTAAVTGEVVGRAFQVVFVVVSLYVALRVRVTDLYTALVTPPLVYAAATFVASLLDNDAAIHTVRRGLEDVGLNLSLNAPWLIGTMAGVVLICLVRRLRARRD